MDVRVLIIEDQPSLAKDIETQVALQPGFTVIGKTASVREALVVIPATSPDLVLMDIALGDGNAFDILEELVPLSFKVIFLTSFKQFAIRAIKFGALDYLLKPLDPLELAQALDKVMAATTVEPSQLVVARQQLQRKEMNRIALKEGPFVHIVGLSQIVYAHYEGQTRFVLADGKKIQVAKTLKDFEEILPSAVFIRPHQSFLVNTQNVTRYHKDGYLQMINGDRVPVSERRRDFIMSFLTTS